MKLIDLIKKWIVKSIWWTIWEFLGLNALYKKIVPPSNMEVNSKNYRNPTTFGLWIFSIYFACLGFATARHERMIDRAEFKYNTLTTQLAAGMPFESSRIIEVGSFKIPVEPKFEINNINFIKTVWASIFGKKIYYYSTIKKTTIYNNGLTVKNIESNDEFLLFMTELWKHNLSNSKLLAANLTGGNLWGANFAKANLTKANLINSNLKETNFEYAIINDANLSGANLYQANLSEAFLNKANLDKANLIGANLDGANLREALLNEVAITRANAKKANFFMASLEGANFSNSNLEGVIFVGANLKKAIFDKCRLVNASFEGANLEGAVFSEANLQGAYLGAANLQYSILWQIDLANANCTEADFSYADMTGGNLKGTILDGAILTNADLTNVKFGGNEEETIKQLSKTSSLYGTILPQEIMNKLKLEHPSLFRLNQKNDAK